MKITLPQQSLNLLRQFLAVVGVAKTSDAVYLDGELLVITLPKIDLGWVLAPRALAKLTDAQRSAYEKKDAAWASKEMTFELREDQHARIGEVLKLVPTLVEMPNGEAVFRLYHAFGLRPTAPAKA